MTRLIDIVLPLDTHEGTESILGRWFKKVGDPIKLHEPIAEINTDKVIVEVAAPGTGTLVEILKLENAPVKPGDLLGRISTEAASQSVGIVSDRVSTSPKSATSSSTDQGEDLSPAVKRLLKEHNLNASDIRGTGRGGRITSQDILDRVASGGAKSESSGLPSHSVSHTPMRRIVAKHMVESLIHTAPHVTSVFEADLSSIIAHREANKASFEKNGAKLTFTSYFVAASVKALQSVPEVNSRWHDDRLELFETCNIGIGTALATGGLIVPVLKDAQNLDLFETAKRLQDLTTRARENALKPEEVQGGTFTISNHGVSGSLVATPIIINQPQSAILGIGKLEKRVKVIEKSGKEEIASRPCVYVTLTIDHRVLDGFQANSFLSAFVETLVNWK